VSERKRVYIGGPLNNKPVEQIGDHWSHFRDDEGRPIPDDVGDAEWNGNRERFYYWATQAPGGITYVHLTWIDESGRVTG
jgi:hypothetical protein